MKELNTAKEVLDFMVARFEENDYTGSVIIQNVECKYDGYGVKGNIVVTLPKYPRMVFILNDVADIDNMFLLNVIRGRGRLDQQLGIRLPESILEDMLKELGIAFNFKIY